MSDAFIEQISPGPCGPGGCPPPTEIVCISVPKVYDFCFEQDTGLTNCITPVVTIPPGSTATCTVTSVTCTAGTPAPTGVDGLATVSVVVTVTYDLTVTPPPPGVPIPITGNTFVFTKTVTVCGPVGTSADCSATVACGPCTIITTGAVTQICCAFSICLLIETFAVVKLLVPAYGFCTPAPCRTGGFPPCPPSPLFPPQCTV
ncbi:MAG TPA: hypothetical protein GXX28_08215 [Firmicutes bacterium]|nr:hypothetical protein [Bacillota bacterium]